MNILELQFNSQKVKLASFGPECLNLNTSGHAQTAPVSCDPGNRRQSIALLLLCDQSKAVNWHIYQKHEWRVCVCARMLVCALYNVEQRVKFGSLLRLISAHSSFLLRRVGCARSYR